MSCRRLFAWHAPCSFLAAEIPASAARFPQCSALTFPSGTNFSGTPGSATNHAWHLDFWQSSSVPLPCPDWSRRSSSPLNKIECYRDHTETLWQYVSTLLDFYHFLSFTHLPLFSYQSFINIETHLETGTSAQVSSSMSGNRVICIVVPSLIFRVSMAMPREKLAQNDKMWASKKLLEAKTTSSLNDSSGELSPFFTTSRHLYCRHLPKITWFRS